MSENQNYKINIIRKSFVLYQFHRNVINNVDFEYQPEYNKDSKVMKDIKRIKRMKNA